LTIGSGSWDDVAMVLHFFCAAVESGSRSVRFL